MIWKHTFNVVVNDCVLCIRHSYTKE